MKKIDLDQIPKKNPYKMPENALEDVQNNVFAHLNQIQGETITPKPAKVFSIGWKYASAAAIFLVFGISFFFMGGFEQSKSNTIANMVDSTFTMNDYESHLAVKQHSDDEILEQLYSSVEEPNSSQNENKKEVIVGKKPVKVKAVNAELDEDLDVILSAYSSNEIAKLSREAEHDVYLDIFH